MMMYLNEAALPLSHLTQTEECTEQKEAAAKEDEGINSKSDGEEDVHYPKFGEKIRRTGKAFSYTFWRTQIEDDVFWSVQGVDGGGGNKSTIRIITKHFGPQGQGGKFRQEITLLHPTEKKIKITYASSCHEGENYVDISKCVVNQFKNGNNTFDFDFRIVKLKRKPYPIRMMV